MFLSPQIAKCSNCGSLKHLYDEVECSLLDMMNRKWINTQFNTSLKFDQSLYNDLVRYKRLLYKRMFNPTYPSPSIDVQDIITQATLRVYKKGDCSQCVDCFPPIPISPTTTSTSTSTTTIG